MNNISNYVISVEEANAALRCMRLSGLSESETLETLDELALRIRNLTDAKLLQDIIENRLSDAQAQVVKRYWYLGENTMEIGKALNVSQANAYRTLTRANNEIRTLMTPLIQYHNDLKDVSVVPMHITNLADILSAQKREPSSIHEALRNLRVSYAITPEHLARNLKIPVRELTDIECGKKIPAPITASRYTALFNATIKMEFHNGRGIYECKIQH